MKNYWFPITLALLSCSDPGEGPIATELLALPVQIGAPAHAPRVQVTCDVANCSGTLTVTQTVPMGIGTVEVWEAAQVTASGAYVDGKPGTMVTQSSGMVVTRTPLTNFRQNERFYLLTSVVVRNAAGNIIGAQSEPVVSNGAGGVRLQLQPSAVTATVVP